MRINGQGTLSGGEIQDIQSGLRVHDISLAAEGTGQQIRIRQFRGLAGDGSVSGTGTIDLSQTDIPVNFTLTAQNARPLVSDRLSATMDANLRITGTVKREIVVAGNVDVTRGEITLPEKAPPTVVVLDVRRPQKGPAEPEAEPSLASIRYDLTITTRGRVLVRGRGIEAEVGGTAGVRGTASMPEITGGFDLRRGTFTAAGRTFMLTSGRVTFDGISIRNKIDPALDLVAENSTAGITAKIAVTGYASAPRIELSSTPTMPADEILARVLFQQSTAQLSPGQLAQLAETAVSLTSGGSGFDPLGAVRRQLGLSRLNLGGGGEETSGTTVEAGKYVFRNVYVGAKQGLEGGTQAEVQVDLTNRLKIVGSVNTGANTTVTQGAKQRETGSSIGLSYQFEY
jgi:translocation and assembly module TamB